MFVFQFSLLTFLLSLVKTPFESLIIAHENMSYYAYVSILDVALKLLNAFFFDMVSGGQVEIICCQSPCDCIDNFRVRAVLLS